MAAVARPIAADGMQVGISLGSPMEGELLGSRNQKIVAVAPSDVAETDLFAKNPRSPLYHPCSCPFRART